MFAFVTSLYRKPTFTGLYLSWNAFAPKSRKVNLIMCLTFRILKICSDNKIKSEFEQIKNSFSSNGYPEEPYVVPSKLAILVGGWNAVLDPNLDRGAISAGTNTLYA